MNRLFQTVASLGLVTLLACGGGEEGPILAALPDSPPDKILLSNVRILDVANGTLGAPSFVLIDGGKITAITPTEAPAFQVTGEVTTIEGEGATLLPGLIDMHGHIATSTGPSWELTAPPTPALNMRSYVYSGVTTVFDPGDASGDEAFARRGRVAARKQIGPQIFTAGPIITVAGGHPVAMIDVLVPAWLRWLVPELAKVVDDKDQINAVVDGIATAGADAIKIVVDRIPLDSKRMSTEQAAAVVARAKTHGLRTVAHVGTTQDTIDAAHAGVALWVHGVYQEPIPEDQIATIISFDIPMVATSEVFDSYGRSQSPVQPTRLERETVRPEILDSFYPMPEDFDIGPLRSWVDLMAETREVRQDNIRRLHAAGQTILAGSDVQSRVFPGPALHRELQNLVDSGLTPAEAIRAATIDSARYLDETDDPSFGVIGVGKRADLLLVDGDPTQDVGVLANLRAVILKGVPIKRTALSD